MAIARKAAHELEAGDKFVGWGPGWVIVGVDYAGMSDIGSDRDRTHFIAHLENTETGETSDLPMNGNSRASMIA